MFQQFSPHIDFLGGNIITDHKNNQYTLQNKG